MIDERAHGGRLARNFAAQCAEDVLVIFERKFPKELALRRAIGAARDDNATPEEREEAEKAVCHVVSDLLGRRTLLWQSVNAAAYSAVFAVRGSAEAASEASTDAAVWADQTVSRPNVWRAQAIKLRKMLMEGF